MPLVLWERESVMCTGMVHFLSSIHLDGLDHSRPLSNEATCLCWPDPVLPMIVGDTAYFSCEWTPNLYLGHQYFLTLPQFPNLSQRCLSEQMGDCIQKLEDHKLFRKFYKLNRKKSPNYFELHYGNSERINCSECAAIPCAIHVRPPLSIFVKLNFI